MAVYAPGDSPGNAYDPPPNVDPGLWARIMGFASGLNPIGGAQAAESVAQGPNPLTNPSPVPQALQGGGPPVPQSLVGGPSAPPMPPWSPPGPAVPPMAAAGPPETRRMPFPNQIDPKGVFAPAQRTPVGAAVGGPAAPSSMFTQVDRPNADVAGGALSRGGPPSMTALNLGALFGGGGQPAEPKKSVRVTKPDEPKKKKGPRMTDPYTYVNT